MDLHTATQQKSNLSQDLEQHPNELKPPLENRRANKGRGNKRNGRKNEVLLSDSKAITKLFINLKILYGKEEQEDKQNTESVQTYCSTADQAIANNKTLDANSCLVCGEIFENLHFFQPITKQKTS